MANRYWVGGTGTWDTTNTANWSTSSGGAGGASAPTSADAVFFDASSDSGTAYTVTASGGVCASISTTSASLTPLTITGSATASGATTFGQYTIWSGLTLTLTPAANMTFSFSGSGTQIIGTNTINYNSNVTYTITFSPATGGSVTIRHFFNAGTATNQNLGSTSFNVFVSLLGSTANVTHQGTYIDNLVVSAGTFTMSGATTVSTVELSGGTLARSTFTLTITGLFLSSGSSTRTLTGSATIVISASANVFIMTDATNFSLGAPTTLSLTNTTTTVKNLVGPTTGATASNTFSISLAAGAAGPFSIRNSFLDVSSSSTATKTLNNFARTIYGSFNSFGANTTYQSGTEVTTFAATTTGKTAAFPALTNSPDFPITFDGVGGAWTFTHGTGGTNSNVTVTTGSVTFSNNMTLNSISSNNSNTRTINISGSSVITLKGSTPLNLGVTSPNLSMATNTSTITCDNASVTFYGGGKAFNNVSFLSSVNFIDIYGANTFAGTLSFPNRTVGYGEVIFNSNQTIGTAQLNHSSTSSTASARTRFRSSNPKAGTTVLLSVTTFTNVIDCDFAGIGITGTGLIVSGTNRGGDLGFNSNIAFPTAKTVYLVSGTSGSVSWNSNVWATSSGGAAANANYPLAQDTGWIDDNSFTGTSTIVVTANSNNLVAFPTVDFTSLSIDPVTFSITNPEFYGGIALASPVTLALSGTAYFLGPAASRSISTSGKTWDVDTQVILNGGTLAPAAAFTQSSDKTFSLLLGTLNTSNFVVTFGTLDLNSAVGTRTISFGSSSVIILTAFYGAPLGSGLIINPGTSTIALGAGGTGATFNGASRTYNNITVNAASVSSFINGSNTFNNVIRGPYGVVGGPKTTYVFEAGSTQTITGSFLTGGALGANSQLAIRSSVPGTRFNLSKTSGTNSVLRTDIQDSNATGGAVWQAYFSNDNVNSGNNLGWDFGNQSNFLALMF
jgi:hypothetical protein